MLRTLDFTLKNRILKPGQAGTGLSVKIEARAPFLLSRLVPARPKSSRKSKAGTGEVAGGTLNPVPACPGCSKLRRDDQDRSRRRSGRERENRDALRRGGPPERALRHRQERAAVGGGARRSRAPCTANCKPKSSRPAPAHPPRPGCARRKFGRENSAAPDEVGEVSEVGEIGEAGAPVTALARTDSEAATLSPAADALGAGAHRARG